MGIPTNKSGAVTASPFRNKYWRFAFRVLIASAFFLYLAAVMVGYRRIDEPREVFESEMVQHPTPKRTPRTDRSAFKGRIALMERWDQRQAEAIAEGEKPADFIRALPVEGLESRTRPEPEAATPWDRPSEAMDFGYDIQVTTDSYRNVYHDICTDPTNGNVHIVYEKLYYSGGWYRMGIYYKRSTDGGLSFLPEIAISTDSYYYSPRVAARGNYVYITVCWDDETIDYFISSNGGASFGGYRELSSESDYVTSPDITIDNNNYVYISYTRVTVSGGDCDDPEISSGNIYYRYSANFGVSWYGPYTITTNSNAGSYIKMANIQANSEATAGYADLHVAIMYDQGSRYLDAREQAFDLYYIRVTDAGRAHLGGMSLGTFTSVYYHSGTNWSYYWWNCFGVKDNTVFLGYCYFNNYVTYRKSTNNGSTWVTSPSAWTSSYWITFSCDYDANPIATVCQSTGYTYTGSSDDGGTTWWPLRRVNDVASSSQGISSGVSSATMRRADVAWNRQLSTYNWNIFYDNCLQWRCSITLTGVDASHPVTTEAYTIWGQAVSLTFNASGTYNIWVDHGTMLTFPEFTGGTDPRRTPNARSWMVNTNLSATINYQAPGMWRGVVSNEWENPGNWSAIMVPIASTQVTIPATPEGFYWPTRTGDITIGGSFANCASIAMYGSSELTVTGNWTNNTPSGFSSGNGKVIFSGTGGSNIQGSVLTVFNNVKITPGKTVFVQDVTSGWDVQMKHLDVSGGEGKLLPQGNRVNFYGP